MESIKDRKLSIRRKALPQVRQTRTSAYRILKANPLMMHDKESIEKMGFKNLNNIPQSVDVLGISLRKYDSKTTSTIDISKTKPQISNLSVNSNAQLKLKTKTSTYRRNNNRSDNIVKTSKNTHDLNTSTFFPKRKAIEAHCIMYKDKMKHNIKRRSKSAEWFNPNKFIKKSIVEKATAKLEISRSMENIQQKSNVDFNISSVLEEQQNIIFKTPRAYNRRSFTCCTPSSGWKSYKSYSSTPTPTDLEKRLNDWLVKRGKSIGSFHHLKCFGVNKAIVDSTKEIKKNYENKENIEVKTKLNDSGTYGHLENCGTFKVNTEVAEKLNYELIARDALDDLNKLIQDNYPSDQCEAWLGKIRHKYQHIEDEPLYWECRAALEQCKGNITSAVEHYRKAIVKGAEVQTIEESLDHLLHKFSLLHIDPELSKDDMKSRKIILDARNAFKSTIIQFAVQERILKKKEDNTKKTLFVTPVRRSARLSMTPQSRTSGMKLCATLKEVDLNENTKFKTNNYLSIRFTPK